jgi:hypothetical protein
MSDTATVDEVQAEVEADAEAQAEGTEVEKKERAKTTYFDPTAVDALDELPDNPKIKREGGGRAKIYHDLLEKIAEQGVDNKWRPLARFGTSSGAKTVALALNRQVAGEIGEEKGQVKPDQVKDIPEYEGFNWVFDSRRVPSENDPDKIESVLYAKLVENEA